MNQMYTGAEKIGEIVSGFPRASNLLKDHNIDFCCGGNRSLSVALRQQNIDEKSFIEKLNQAYTEANKEIDPSIDWREVSLAELIDHIVNTHHVYLFKELPFLSEFVTKILRVHGHAHEEIAKLHQLFYLMKAELEQHLITEEEAVFPLIKQYESDRSSDSLHKAVQAIEELEAEHSAVGDILKEMRTVTGGYELPEGACRTYTITYQKLQELESDMFQHIHLENNILFSRVSQA